jgi:hypothetical protein
MAKFGKRVYSDWNITTHTVNSYKNRVADPALKRKKRKAREIRTVLSRALNRVKNTGKEVDIRSESFRGRSKIRHLYRIHLFKGEYYALCQNNVVITLFTPEMIANDVKKGGLTFIQDEPFRELQPLYAA